MRSRHLLGRAGTAWRIAVPAIAFLGACSNPDQERMQRGVAFASGKFRETTRNPIALMALGATLEQGGQLTSYIVNAIPEKSDLPIFSNDRPSKPWSVVLRVIATDRVTVEGFGATLAKPVVAETIAVRIPPPPK